MKKLFTLFTLALLAALGLGGGNVALAAVETYDFAEFVAGGVPDLTLTSTEVIQAGTNAKTLYVVGNQTNKNGTTTLSLNRIALCSHSKSNFNMKWVWRSSSSNAYQNGLGGSWNGKGSAVTSFNISILKLYQGDKVTITYAIRSGKSAQPHVCSSGVLTGLDAGAIIASKTTYTVAKDGNLDMYVTDNNMAIQKIVIESDKVAESIESPAISVVGAYNGARIVKIASKKTNEENPTTTYYTLDGTDPTTSSAVYSGNITVSPTDSPDGDGKVVVKALTIKTGNASVKSDISQLLVENLGTTVQLNAPSYYIASMQPKGSYVAPEYGFSSNQSDVIGTPSVSYFYQVDGGEVKAGSSFTPTAKCSLSIIARSEGYAENSTTIDINAYLLKKVKDYDFTAFKEHSEETVGSMSNINGKGCQAYALATDAIENITLDNITLMWAITANKALGLYARTDAGKVTYNGAFPEGSVILYKDIYNASYWSTSNVLNIALYGSVKSMEVYNALTDEELEEWEKIQNSFIPVDGPTYDPDKAPEGGIESATRPEHGMATSPSDTTQSDNTNGTATGINGAEAEAQIVSIVNVNGAKVNSLQKGINIVTYSNGKRVKVLK
ncbi:MAG: chitobiase/beta-hexosaminidase C-terminal domain-containing protein [Prevotella sp.]|nr:chitobiase/beta-hexosaminidase C-terminal domain-containing protein [Prevotella sp.]